MDVNAEREKLAKSVLKSEEAVIRQLHEFKKLMKQQGELNEQQWTEVERRREAYLAGEVEASS